MQLTGEIWADHGRYVGLLPVPEHPQLLLVVEVVAVDEVAAVLLGGEDAPPHAQHVRRQALAERRQHRVVQGVVARTALRKVAPPFYTTQVSLGERRSQRGEAFSIIYTMG